MTACINSINVISSNFYIKKFYINKLIINNILRYLKININLN